MNTRLFGEQQFFYSIADFFVRLQRQLLYQLSYQSNWELSGHCVNS